MLSGGSLQHCSHSGGGGWDRDGGGAGGQMEKETGVWRLGDEGQAPPVTSWAFQLSEVPPHRKRPHDLTRHAVLGTCARTIPFA